MKHLFLILISLIGITTIAQNNFNKLDENGNKNGHWQGLFEESHRIRYEGNFEHGKEVGIFTYYDDTKIHSVVATREFNKKDASAYTIFFNQTKNIVSEGKVVDKMREGQWKYYHEDSKVVMNLENYKNGKLDGIRTVYFPSGKIAEETGYVDGIKNGIYKKYVESGVILEDAVFKNGEYNGSATYKAPDGKVVAKGLFKEGKKVGIWEFYDENGKLKKENFNYQGKKFQKNKNARTEPDEY